jgi:hypothetical protein
VAGLGSTPELMLDARVIDPVTAVLYVNVQVVPLVRLIAYGVVPDPAQDATVPEWPPSEIVIVFGVVVQLPVRLVIVKLGEGTKR